MQDRPGRIRTIEVRSLAMHLGEVRENLRPWTFGLTAVGGELATGRCTGAVLKSADGRSGVDR